MSAHRGDGWKAALRYPYCVIYPVAMLAAVGASYVLDTALEWAVR